jgi:hypothetical protein
LLDLVLVTGLLLTYGPTRWSWLAGPSSALAMWLLHNAGRHSLSEPAPRHAQPGPARSVA